MNKLLNTADLNEVKQAIKDNVFVTYTQFEDDASINNTVIVSMMVDGAYIAFDLSLAGTGDDIHDLLQDIFEVDEEHNFSIECINVDTFGNCAGIDGEIVSVIEGMHGIHPFDRIDNDIIDFVNFDDDQKLVAKRMVDDIGICFDDAIQKVRNGDYYLLKDSAEIDAHFEAMLDEYLVERYGPNILSDYFVDKDVKHFKSEMRHDYMMSGDDENGPLVMVMEY